MIAYLACFITEQSTTDDTFSPLENKVGLKLQPNASGNYCIFYHKTNKEDSTALCSVVKHLGSGRVLKKRGKTLEFKSPFSSTLLSCSAACFITEQSIVEASLLVK